MPIGGKWETVELVDVEGNRRVLKLDELLEAARIYIQSGKMSAAAYLERKLPLREEKLPMAK